jgi:hypothetical protein
MTNAKRINKTTMPPPPYFSGNRAWETEYRKTQP